MHNPDKPIGFVGCALSSNIIKFEQDTVSGTIHKSRDVLNNPDIFGVDCRVVGWSGAGHRNFPNILLYLKPFFLGEFCLYSKFLQSKSGINKMIQYVPYTLHIMYVDCELAKIE